jgi:hypothetical protein
LFTASEHVDLISAEPLCAHYINCFNLCRVSVRLFDDDVEGESESPVKKKKKKTNCHIDLPMPPPITPPFKRHVASSGSPVRIVAGKSDVTVNQLSSPATADHSQKSAVGQSAATDDAVSLTNLQSFSSPRRRVEERSIKSVNHTASPPDLSDHSTRTSPRRSSLLTILHLLQTSLIIQL